MSPRKPSPQPSDRDGGQKDQLVREVAYYSDRLIELENAGSPSKGLADCESALRQRWRRMFS